MEISEDDIENIREVANSVRRKILSNHNRINDDEVIKLRTNPLKYFMENGLRQSIRRTIQSVNILYNEFQSAFRSIARNILNRVIGILDDCFQCVVGLLILIMIIFVGASIDYPLLMDLKETLIYTLEIYFGANILVKGIVTKLVDTLKRAGLPHLSPNNLAQYLCYQVGICSEKGIL